METDSTSPTYPFVITIDDKYSKYEYLFYLSDQIATYDIIKVIANHYHVPVPQGKIKN